VDPFVLRVFCFLLLMWYRSPFGRLGHWPPTICVDVVRFCHGMFQIMIRPFSGVKPHWWFRDFVFECWHVSFVIYQPPYLDGCCSFCCIASKNTPERNESFRFVQCPILVAGCCFFLSPIGTDFNSSTRIYSFRIEASLFLPLSPFVRCCDGRMMEASIVVDDQLVIFQETTKCALWKGT
jgi:hypothetical protein